MHAGDNCIVNEEEYMIIKGGKVAQLHSGKMVTPADGDNLCIEIY